MTAARPAQRARSPDGVAGPLDLATALDEAIARLQAGGSIDECLAALPELATELRSLLETALLVQQLSVPLPPPGAKARVRARVMAAAEARLGRAHRASRLQPLGAAVAASGAVLLGGGVVAASANALPGEPLYPVKLAVEQAHVAATDLQGDPATRVELQNELAERRLAEAEALASQGRPVPPGVVESAVRHLEAAGRLATQLPAPERGTAERRLAEAQAKQAQTLERVLKDAPPPAQTPLARIVEQGRGAGAGPAASSGPGQSGPRGGAERASPTPAAVVTATSEPLPRREGQGAAAGRAGSPESAGSRPATPPANRGASRDGGGQGNEPRSSGRSDEMLTGGPQMAPAGEHQGAQEPREGRDQAGPGNPRVREGQDQAGPGQADHGGQAARSTESQVPVEAERPRDRGRSDDQSSAHEPAVSVAVATETRDQASHASQTSDGDEPRSPGGKGGGNERGSASGRGSSNDPAPVALLPPVPVSPAQDKPEPGERTRGQRSDREAGLSAPATATGASTSTPTATPTVPGRGKRGGSDDRQDGRG